MSKEVELAKERLKELRYKTRDVRSGEERYANDQWLGLSNIEALETILSELARLEADEIEHYDIDVLVTELRHELIEKDKIIELMAEEFVYKTLMHSDMSKQEVIQYFESKVKEDEE